MIFNILSFISLAIFVDAVALKSNPKVISFDFELRFSDPIKRDTNFGTGTAAPVRTLTGRSLLKLDQTKTQ